MLMTHFILPAKRHEIRIRHCPYRKNTDAVIIGFMRQTLFIVALLNLLYFGVEFTSAWLLQSVSLFADAVDFLEDASVNLLALLALGWSIKARARLGMGLAAITLLPALGALWMVWQHISHQTVPHGAGMSWISVGALMVNSLCAILLVRHRHSGGSLTTAAFLCARNDVIANIAIIITGIITMVWASSWPDVVTGTALALLNIHAAREIYEAASHEYHEGEIPHTHA
jgi:Co/Zn/Cd efflux system component